MATTALIDQAKSLQSAARRMGDKDAVVQKEEKTYTALRKLDAALDRLEALQKTFARALHEGVPIGATPPWADGLQGLKEHMGRGRPTPQAITAAATKVGKTADAVTTAVANAWGEWSSTQLASVQSERVPLLPIETRTDTSERIRRLQSMVRSTPNLALILEFTNSLEIVRERLEDASASIEVHDALEKVNAGLALSAFSDAELAALRSERTVADQIILRRRP